MRYSVVLMLALVVGMMAIPLGSATTMHATLNTQTNVASVNTTSNYVLYYTYSAGSNASNQLNGTVMWLNATSYVNATTRQEIQQDMNHVDVSGNASSGTVNATGTSSTNATVIHVINATIAYQVHAFANQTNLTVYRNMTLHMTVTNFTKKTGSNSTVVDMSWRAFGVQGKLESMFRGNLAVKVPFLNITVNASITSNIDVNELGDMNLGIGGGNSGSIDLRMLFEQSGFNGDIASYNTVNFHVFSKPLSTWVRVYDSSANTTTFYYNASTNYTVNSTINDNGSIYTLKLRIDPSAAMTTNGDAEVTSANDLAIVSYSPQGASTTYLVAIVVIAVVLVGGISGYAVSRRRRKD
ncbi:MAG: hypothetical protein AMDU3_IPLC00001G0294 [Thermoplasmatales archaeon I-plasma]|nr:MAG: hypothetical protein AMDU3_IPLC00001G0294 [Thermoplasmatales archaeon I-plasma]